MTAGRTQHVTSGAALTMVPAIVWVRYAVQTTVLLVLLGPRLGRRLVATPYFVLHIVRDALMVTASLVMVIAFSAMLLVAAAAGASHQVLTRKLALEDTRTMLFYASVVGAVVLTALMPWRGVPGDFAWLDIAMLAIPGLLAAGGHFLFIRAFQLAPASGLASITCLQLVFATVLGVVAFGDFPDGWTLLGMAVIAASRLFLALYERRRHLMQMAEPPAVD